MIPVLIFYSIEESKHQKGLQYYNNYILSNNWMNGMKEGKKETIKWNIK